MITLEIWSDINCPYCYIGKRHLEIALKDFHDEEVQVEWKSFELDPLANPPKGVSNDELLAKKYGRDLAWAREMNANMTKMAADAGLQFHMDKVVPANSFNAHKLLHLAKKHGKQNALKEGLLRAKFVEGRDIGNKEELLQIAVAQGLPDVEVKMVLDTDQFSPEVRQEEQTAAQLGIRGVPFFLFDKQYALSGAHPPEAFTQTLKEIMSKR